MQMMHDDAVAFLHFSIFVSITLSFLDGRAQCRRFPAQRHSPAPSLSGWVHYYSKGHFKVYSLPRKGKSKTIQKRWTASASLLPHRIAFWLFRLFQRCPLIRYQAHLPPWTTGWIMETAHIALMATTKLCDLSSNLKCLSSGTAFYDVPCFPWHGGTFQAALLAAHLHKLPARSAFKITSRTDSSTHPCM